MAPKLAVCIPTFDREELLRPLLDSFVHQPGAEGIQIVVSDNASADGTEDLCRDYARRWRQIRYVRAPENRGPDHNFLSAVAHADAEFCWLFGSDDVARPGSVARVLDLLDEADPDILLFDRVWCDYWMQPARIDHFLRTDGRAEFDTRRGGDVRRYLDASTGLCALLSYLSSTVVRKSRWDGTPPMDEYLGSAYVHTAKLLSVFSSGAHVEYVPEPLVLCRGDNEGLMEHGLFNRARIDFVWYARLVDQFFPREPAHGAALRVVRREFTVPRLLLLAAEAADGEPRELLERMRVFRYPRTTRAAVGLAARVAPLRALLRGCAAPARAFWWRRSRHITAAELHAADEAHSQAALHAPPSAG
ncbi:MAG: glycosyltransferase family 2 protein [Thermoleophilia bacterium]